MTSRRPARRKRLLPSNRRLVFGKAPGFGRGLFLFCAGGGGCGGELPRIGSGGVEVFQGLEVGAGLASKGWNIVCGGWGCV